MPWLLVREARRAPAWNNHLKCFQWVAKIETPEGCWGRWLERLALASSGRFIRGFLEKAMFKLSLKWCRWMKYCREADSVFTEGYWNEWISRDYEMLRSSSVLASFSSSGTSYVIISHRNHWFNLHSWLECCWEASYMAVSQTGACLQIIAALPLWCFHGLWLTPS